MNPTVQSHSEEQILRAVKMVLTHVIRDTATAPGMKHPLSEQTILGLRDCLVLISQREQEFDREAGRINTARPHFTDEPPAEVRVSLESLKQSRH